MHEGRDGEDEFWQLGEFLPEKKPGRVFARDTEAVPLSLGGEDAPAVKIPPRPADASERLARAQAALGAAEAKLGLDRRPVSHPDPRPDPRSVPRPAAQPGDGEYEQINRRREEMIRRADPAASAPEEYCSENPLIEAVRLIRWPVNYVFYGSFLSAAEKMHPLHGEPAPAVPFFSYMPQYQQLSRPQRAFYLWFREEARNGRFIDADFSYILLYIYEILNLPDRIPPEKGVEQLCLLWANYRKGNPKLDRYLTEWVCDYCLIHRVRVPWQILQPFYPEIVRLAVLKPFWLGEDRSSPSPVAAAAFGYASNYNYGQSKFISEQNRALFDTHMRAGFSAAFAGLEKAGNDWSKGIGICPRSALKGTSTRDAYAGAVCAYELKYKIEVDALMLIRSVEFRFMVTDLVKYIENQIRALLGIKSRFHTRALDPAMKAGVDAYFAPLLAGVREGKRPAPKPAPVPEYEKLYEPLRSDFSPEWAAQIERDAWKTTRLLTEEDGEGSEEYEEYEEPDESAGSGEPEKSAGSGDPAPAEAPGKRADPGISPSAAPEEEEETLLYDGFSALLSGDRAAFASAAAKRRLLPDTLAERLNEAALDIVGDVALEENGDGWTLLPDYKEDIAEWMKSKSRNES